MTPTGESSATGHPSELELHRVALGQLPPDRRATVEAHAAGCPTCAGALASLRLDPPEDHEGRPDRRWHIGVNRSVGSDRPDRVGSGVNWLEICVL